MTGAAPPPPEGDSTKPLWTNQSQSAGSVSQLGSVVLTALGFDETNLTMAWLATNESGYWVNWTGAGMSKYGSPITVISPASTWNETNFTWTNSTLPGSTDVSWRIYYNDSSGNINETNILTFTLLDTISLSTIVGSVGFNTQAAGATDDTLDYSPFPFVLRNDGNVNMNITIGAPDLFPANPSPTPAFQFNSSLNESGAILYSTDLVAAFTNVYSNASAGQFANNLIWNDTADEVQGNIRITVPTNDSAGQRITTVSFNGKKA